MTQNDTVLANQRRWWRVQEEGREGGVRENNKLLQLQHCCFWLLFLFQEGDMITCWWAGLWILVSSLSRPYCSKRRATFALPLPQFLRGSDWHKTDGHGLLFQCRHDKYFETADLWESPLEERAGVCSMARDIFVPRKFQKCTHVFQ